MLGRFQRGEHAGKLLNADAQPSHAGIDFQMHRMPRHAQRGGGGFQRLDMPGLPDRGREVQADNLGLLAPPEAGHQQDVGMNARLAQRNRFVQRRHAQPLRAFGFESARALDRAVTVGVGLHHGAHGDARSHVLLHRAEVLPQRGQRNFRPGRTGRHAAQDFCCACHFRDYSGSSPRAQVTLGLLPRKSRVLSRRGGRILP